MAFCRTPCACLYAGILAQGVEPEGRGIRALVPETLSVIRTADSSGGNGRELTRTVAENRALRRFGRPFGRGWRKTRLNGGMMAQSRLRKPLAFACAACFELLVSVFASSAALLSVFSELASLQNFTDRLQR